MKPSFERSPETDILVVALRGVNNEASYSALAAQAGMAVSRVKVILSSARRILMRENIMFGIARGVGVVRLDDAQKLDSTDERLTRITRSSKRGLKELGAIDAERLSNQDQIRHTTNRTIFGLISKQGASRVTPEKTPKKAVQPIPDAAKIVSLGKR